MAESLILFGAGAAGRYALKYLRSKGIEPIYFADNNADLWGTEIFGIPVVSPYSVNVPDAEWVVTAISRPAATEIRAQLKSLGVKTKPLWECLDVQHGLPSDEVCQELLHLAGDQATFDELLDQFAFRKQPNYDLQSAPSDCKNIYFPDFIKHRDDEHFVDVGCADGDTVQGFRERWKTYWSITAFEPDASNFIKARAVCEEIRGDHAYNCAVSDKTGVVQFNATGDYSASLTSRGNCSVVSTSLDDCGFAQPPTYIKMDIEGSELEALWGARRILKDHSPVLAICAYHKSDHLWQIPLLIHAIQPGYKLFFRRYAEGAFEIVWYAVPPDRVINGLEAQRQQMQRLATGENE